MFWKISLTELLSKLQKNIINIIVKYNIFPPLQVI